MDEKIDFLFFNNTKRKGIAMTEIPYGDYQLEVAIEGAELLEWDVSNTGAERSGSDIIKDAIEHPVGTKRLNEIIAARDDDSKIVIVVDDHTRDTPTVEMLDALVREIGDCDNRITILVACGTHSPPSAEELNRILGKYARQFEVVVHDCDAPDLVYVGTTARGTPVWLNRTYVDADIRILTGDITLHYYAGFGGGRKSILPGISSRETIKQNHALLIDERASAANITDNPVHQDMTDAAAFAPPDFIINTIADASGAIVSAYAGDLNAVFEKGTGIAKELLIHETDLFDAIVVSAGGFPKDRNLYQATKAIQNCYNAVKPGGCLILVAECREGIGDAFFEEWMNSYESYEATEEAIRAHFVLGGHKAFYMRKVMRYLRLSIVSELDPDLLRNWGIHAYTSLEAALESELNGNFKIGIVRNGLDTLLVPDKLFKKEQ